jgi:hypothetical protein
MRATLTPPYVPPTPPQPPQPEVKVQTPLVFVQPEWEYKLVKMDSAPDEAALNDLGRQGWELVGLVPAADGMQLYFKRLTR